MARTTKAGVLEQQLAEESSAAQAEGVTPDLKLAAQKRAAAAAERDPNAKREQLIEALQAERRGYVSRVAQVDKELGRLGVEA